jgi:hypothetical protein
MNNKRKREKISKANIFNFHVHIAQYVYAEKLSASPTF